MEKLLSSNRLSDPAVIIENKLISWERRANLMGWKVQLPTSRMFNLVKSWIGNKIN